MSPHHRRRSDAPPGHGLRLWRNDWSWWIWHGERIWQDVIPLLAIVLAWIAVSGTETEQDRQKEGRGIAIDVLCGGLYGVEKAGEYILTGTLPGTEDLQPPPTEREKAVAKIYATAYSTVISQAVVKQAGVTGKHILNEDGTIDCDELKKAARAADLDEAR